MAWFLVVFWQDLPVTVVVEGIIAGHRDQAAEGWPQGVEYLRGRIRPHLVKVI